ncbi:hypothetical protein N7536_004108 [Penicillium majusculum]|nr:hypothetical protein N7536_004108 [Penicillium majusculum]
MDKGYHASQPYPRTTRKPNFDRSTISSASSIDDHLSRNRDPGSQDDTHLPTRHGLKNSLQCKKGALFALED